MSGTTGSQGRGVVVTGAGSGIGRATALRFAQLGDQVLVADLHADGAEADAARVMRSVTEAA